jgi:hypothetical protein
MGPLLDHRLLKFATARGKGLPSHHFVHAVDDLNGLHRTLELSRGEEGEEEEQQ